MATQKKRKFSVGGVTPDELETANASEDPIASLNKSKGWTDTEEAPAPARKMSFKEAFAQARKGGGKTFEWNGKKYTTEMAGASKPAAKVTDTGDETARMAARAPAPAKKPAYETPYDRRNRLNREEAAAREASTPKGQDRILRSVRPGAFDSKTLLPTGMKKGGSVSKASSRGVGIAQRGKTKGRLV